MTGLVLPRARLVLSRALLVPLPCNRDCSEPVTACNATQATAHLQLVEFKHRELNHTAAGAHIPPIRHVGAVRACTKGQNKSHLSDVCVRDPSATGQP